jgi:hypothetical protein
MAAEALIVEVVETPSGIKLSVIQVLVTHYNCSRHKGDMGTTPAFRAHTVAWKLREPDAIWNGIDDGEHNGQLIIRGPRTNLGFVRHCGSRILITRNLCEIRVPAGIGTGACQVIRQPFLASEIAKRLPQLFLPFVAM